MYTDRFPDSPRMIHSDGCLMRYHTKYTNTNINHITTTTTIATKAALKQKAAAAAAAAATGVEEAASSDRDLVACLRA